MDYPHIALPHQVAVSENATVWPPEFPRSIHLERCEWRARAVLGAQHCERQVQGQSQVLARFPVAMQPVEGMLPVEG